MAITRACKCGCGVELVSSGRGRPKEWCTASCEARRIEQNRRSSTKSYGRNRLDAGFMQKKREYQRAYYRAKTAGGGK